MTGISISPKYGSCFVIKYFILIILLSLFTTLSGTIHQRRGEIDEALATYVNSLLVEASHVPSKISIGAIMSDRGLPMLPVARTLLSDALRLEPTNRMAWLHLGFVHKLDGRLSDAIDSFQAASMLEESDPIESFNSIL